jgi:hypothetical protein
LRGPRKRCGASATFSSDAGGTYGVDAVANALRLIAVRRGRLVASARSMKGKRGGRSVQVQGSQARRVGRAYLIKGATSGAGTRVLVLNVDGLLSQSLV